MPANNKLPSSRNAEGYGSELVAYRASMVVTASSIAFCAVTFATNRAAPWPTSSATALYVHLDVTSEADWADAIAATEERFGPVSILVNNAGIGSAPVLIEESSLEDWQRIIAVNVTGQYLGIRAMAPSLRRAGGGSIVNIVSMAADVGLAFLAPYVVSKWGVRGLTRTAALELGRDNVRVHSIHPGGVDTPFIIEPLRPGVAPVSDYYSPDAFAIKRLADPQDITNVLLFLTSDEASFITGSDFVSDGGLLLGPAVDDAAVQVAHLQNRS